MSLDASHLCHYAQQLMQIMQGRDPLYDNIPGCGVDPRGLAQRIMAVNFLQLQQMSAGTHTWCVVTATPFVAASIG